MELKLTNLFRDNNRVASIAFAVLIVALIGLSFVPVITRGSSTAEVFLEYPTSDSCVRETGYMRFYHMDLLKEVREDVIRHGTRGEITLSGCRECHTYRDQFCNKCHDAVTLKLDCFGCHYYPESVEDSISIEEGEGHDG